MSQTSLHKDPQKFLPMVDLDKGAQDACRNVKTCASAFLSAIAVFQCATVVSYVKSLKVS